MKKKHTLIALSALILYTALPSAHADELWHNHALRLFVGYQDSYVTVDARDTYEELTLDSKGEIGIGYARTMESQLDFELAISQSRYSGTQKNAAGSGNTGNVLNIDIEAINIYATCRYHFSGSISTFSPWIGAGINTSLLDISQQERLTTAGGLYPRQANSSMKSASGFHLNGGMNFYPSEDSALSLGIEMRYTRILDNSFDGDLGGTAVLFTCNWDFGLSTR